MNPSRLSGAREFVSHLEFKASYTKVHNFSRTMFQENASPPTQINSLTLSQFQILQSQSLTPPHFLKFLKFKNISRIANHAMWHKDTFLNDESSSQQQQDIVLSHVSLKEPQKPAPYEPQNPETYWSQVIKGFDAKVKALKSLLSERKLKECRRAVICAKGNEEEALNFLLMEVGMKVPPVPEHVTREHEHAYQVQMAKYEQDKREWEEMRRITPEELNQIRTLSLLELAQDPILLKKRTLLLQNQINRMKEKIQMQGVAIQKHENKKRKKMAERAVTIKKITTTTSSGIIPTSRGTSNVDRNRLYLPGEHECMMTRTLRLFPFFPERTFANETSHIHFRVAEATFHRFLTVNSCWRVSKVEYIVNPPLRETFDERRRAIAEKRAVSFESVIPYLLYGSHKDDEKSVRYIVENGYSRPVKMVSTIELPHTHNVHTFGQTLPESQSTSRQVVLSLVLPNDKLRLGDERINTVTPNAAEDILPYYLVTCEVAAVTGRTDHRHLDEEWEHFEEDAMTDKKQNEMKEFYRETLHQQSKERSSRTTSDVWFNQFYSKKYEEEKQFRMDDSTPIGGDSAEFEFEIPSDEDSDEDLDTDAVTETPLTGVSTTSDVFMVDDEVDSDGDDLQMSQQ